MSDGATVNRVMTTITSSKTPENFIKNISSYFQCTEDSTNTALAGMLLEALLWGEDRQNPYTVSYMQHFIYL